MLPLPVQQLPSSVSPPLLPNNHKQHSWAGVSSSTVFYHQLLPFLLLVSQELYTEVTLARFNVVVTVPSKYESWKYFFLLCFQKKVEPSAGKRPRGRPRKWVSTVFCPFPLLQSQILGDFQLHLFFPGSLPTMTFFQPRWPENLIC